MNDEGKVYAHDAGLVVDEVIFLETKNFRFSGTIAGIKGVGTK